MSRFSKDDLVNDDYLCALTGRGKSAVATWRRNGTGPAFIRLHNRPYYKVSDIEAWLEANRVNPTAA